MKRPIGLTMEVFVLAGFAVAAGMFMGTTTATTQEGRNVSQRVGHCALAGSWKQTAEEVGTSIWEIDSTGKASESGLGGASGTATLTGNKLRIDWKTSNGFWSGYYEWQLDSDCKSGQGELVFQSGGSGTRKSTVTRQGGGAPGPASEAPPSQAVARVQGTAGLESGTNRPGEDYKNFDLPEARPELCRDACAGDANCRAFTYVKPDVQGPKARCWLKAKVPNAVKDDCCVSGVRGDVNSADGRQPTLPVPSPTPIPPLDTGSSKGMAKFVNEPDHSPDKLDFGEVWNGHSSSRIFRLTANASGYVRAEIPTGPFRVAEIRELGPERMMGGKGTPSQLKGPARDLKGRVTFQAGLPGPWTASADTGNEVQIYVVFEPKFDLFQMTAGEKSATMKVAGPGPKSEWALTVPLRGMFNGLIVGAAFTVEDPEVMAVAGTQRIDVAVRLTGTDSVLQGTIHGKNMPPGIQINPVPVTVNPAQTTNVKVPVFPNWGTLQPDAQARNIELVFEAGQKSSSATFTLTPLPEHVSTGDANRKDCGIEWLGWLAQIYPNGRVILSLSGSNFDLANNRNVIGVVNVAGKPVAYGILHFKIGSGTPDYKQWDSSHLNVDFDSRFRKEDYLSAVQGPVTLTCHLIDFNSKMPF